MVTMGTRYVIHPGVNFVKVIPGVIRPKHQEYVEDGIHKFDKMNQEFWDSLR